MSELPTYKRGQKGPCKQCSKYHNTLLHDKELHDYAKTLANLSSKSSNCQPCTMVQDNIYTSVNSVINKVHIHKRRSTAIILIRGQDKHVH